MRRFWVWIKKSRIKSHPFPWCECNPGLWGEILGNLSCEIKEVKPSLLKIRKHEDVTVLQIYLAPSILSAIIIIGGFGNILLIVIFILNPDMRSGPNVYLMSLTVGDFFNLVVNLPLRFVDNISESWNLGSVTCQIFMFMRDFSVGVSVYSVVALSLQRYVVIVHAVRYREGKFGEFTGYGAYLHVFAVWLVAALFASPSVLSATVEGRRCLNAASKYGQEYMRTIWTAQLLVFCAMPVGIILTL